MNNSSSITYETIRTDQQVNKM